MSAIDELFEECGETLEIALLRDQAAAELAQLREDLDEAKKVLEETKEWLACRLDDDGDYANGLLPIGFITNLDRVLGKLKATP